MDEVIVCSFYVLRFQVDMTSYSIRFRHPMRLCPELLYLMLDQIDRIHERWIPTDHPSSRRGTRYIDDLHGECDKSIVLFGFCHPFTVTTKGMPPFFSPLLVILPLSYGINKAAKVVHEQLQHQ